MREERMIYLENKEDTSRSITREEKPYLSPVQIAEALTEEETDTHLMILETKTINKTQDGTKRGDPMLWKETIDKSSHKRIIVTILQLTIFHLFLTEILGKLKPNSF
jgi:hypothetical protein